MNGIVAIITNHRTRRRPTPSGPDIPPPAPQKRRRTTQRGIVRNGSVAPVFINQATRAIEQEYAGRPTSTKTWFQKLGDITHQLLNLSTNSRNPDSPNIGKVERRKRERILEQRLALICRDNPGLSRSTVRKMFNIATKEVDAYA